MEGRAVNLVSDPTQNTEDRYGRSLLYVDRTDGLDVGRELIRTGWAETTSLTSANSSAFRLLGCRGRSRCRKRRSLGASAGATSTSQAEELADRRDDAAYFTGLYYRRISNRRFLTAWRMLEHASRLTCAPTAGGKRAIAGRLASRFSPQPHGSAVDGQWSTSVCAPRHRRLPQRRRAAVLPRQRDPRSCARLVGRDQVQHP